MLNANDFFKRYLKANDLPGNGVTCQITGVYVDKVFDRQQNEEVAKVHLELNEYPGKPMLPNNTQGGMLIDLFGEDVNGWSGKWVYLSPEKLSNGMVTIRIMAAPQPNAATTPPEPEVPPPTEMTCTACGATIPAGEAVCAACGAPAPPPPEAVPPMEMNCTACGAIIPAGSPTCPTCGAAAPPPTEAPP